MAGDTLKVWLSDIRLPLFLGTVCRHWEEWSPSGMAQAAEVSQLSSRQGHLHLLHNEQTKAGRESMLLPNILFLCRLVSSRSCLCKTQSIIHYFGVDTLPGTTSCLWEIPSPFLLLSGTSTICNPPQDIIASNLDEMRSCPVAPEDAKDLLLLRSWNFNIWKYYSMTLVFGNLVILILNKADTFLPGDRSPGTWELTTAGDSATGDLRNVDAFKTGWHLWKIHFSPQLLPDHL